MDNKKQDSHLAEDREEIINSFSTMWGNFPEPVMLILKSREIVACNKVAEEAGTRIGTKCSTMEPPERHKGCEATKAFETHTAIYHRRKIGLYDTYTFWLPIDGYPDYLIHFPVGVLGHY